MPSLNRDQRRKELMKITAENQAILKRLQDKQPTYSVQKWEEEFKKNELLKLNILEYPAPEYRHTASQEDIF